MALKKIIPAILCVFVVMMFDASTAIQVGQSLPKTEKQKAAMVATSRARAAAGEGLGLSAEEEQALFDGTLAHATDEQMKKAVKASNKLSVWERERNREAKVPKAGVSCTAKNRQSCPGKASPNCCLSLDRDLTKDTATGEVLQGDKSYDAAKKAHKETNGPFKCRVKEYDAKCKDKTFWCITAKEGYAERSEHAKTCEEAQMNAV